METHIVFSKSQYFEELPGDDRNLTGCLLGRLDEASLDRFFQAIYCFFLKDVLKHFYCPVDIYIYICVETCWNQRRLCFRVFSDPPTRCWPMYMLFWTWILEEFRAGRFAVDPITEMKCVSDVLEIKEHSPPDTDKHQLGRYLPTLAKPSQVCIPLLQCSMSNVWIILSKANSW